MEKENIKPNSLRHSRKSMAAVNAKKIKSPSFTTNKSPDHQEKSCSNDSGVKRSGRKRKLKQFDDFEVDYFPGDKGDDTFDDKNHGEQGSKKKHKSYTDTNADKVRDDLDNSESKQNHRYCPKSLLHNENRPSVITPTRTEQISTFEPFETSKPESYTKKSISKSKTIKSFISNDFSPTLKQLNKSGGVFYKCSSQNCSKTFFSLKKLEAHKKTTHGENVRYICRGCAKTFRSFFMFRSHIRMEHSEIQSLVLTFRNAEVVIKDENNVVGSKIMVCTKCGCRYGDQEGPDHMCEPEELRYYCPCCDYHTTNGTQMQNHLSGKHFYLTHGFLYSLPHNPNFKGPQEKSLLKTLCEKKKMLVTSIFSFSHNVFYPIRDRNHI